MNDLEVKVLGSVSPYCKGSKNCPGFLVSYNNEKVLLDCGNGISRLLNLPDDLNNLSILISHFHKDHYGDLLSLGYATYVYHKLGILKNKVKLYIPQTYELNKNNIKLELQRQDHYGKEALLEGMYNKIHQPRNEYHDYLLIKYMKEHYFDIINYNPNSNIKINDLVISFLENKHDITCCSTKLENDNNKVVYTSDTGYGIAQQLIDFAFNTDLLIAESTFTRSDNQFSDNHLHAHQAADIARLAKVKQLLLTHFWPEHDPNDYLNEAKSIFENTIIASEGQILRLGR